MKTTKYEKLSFVKIMTPSEYDKEHGFNKGDVCVVLKYAQKNNDNDYEHVYVLDPHAHESDIQHWMFLTGQVIPYGKLSDAINALKYVQKLHTALNNLLKVIDNHGNKIILAHSNIILKAREVICDTNKVILEEGE
jgi:hypothetical protein